MNARTLIRSVLVAALLSGSLAGIAAAQAYKWKDAQGHVHFTENIYEVPERYRSKVETREMPVHVDPNTAQAEAEKGTLSASFEDGVRTGIGRNLTVKQDELVHNWAKKWAIPFLITFAINVLIGLGMVVHAFVQGKIGWGLANFFIGVSSPFYLVMHVEASAVVRFGLLGLYLSPMVVLFMAMGELTRALG